MPYPDNYPDHYDGEFPAINSGDTPYYDKDVIEDAASIQRVLATIIYQNRTLFDNVNAVMAGVIQAIREDNALRCDIRAFEERYDDCYKDSPLAEARIIEDIKFAATVPAYIMPLSQVAS